MDNCYCVPKRAAMETEESCRSTCFLLIPFFFQQDVDIGELAGQKSNTSRLASMVVHHLNKHPLLCTLFIYSGNDDNMTYKGRLELPTTDQKKSTRFGHFGGFVLDFPIFIYW